MKSSYIKTKINELIAKYKGSNVVFKSSLWFICVTIIDKSVSLLTQPFVNRLLSVDELGIYGVFQSWHSIIFIFATFCLFYGVYEVFLTKNEEDKNNLIASFETLFLIIFSIVFGFCFIFYKPISVFTGLKPSYLILMAFYIFGDALIQFWAVPKRFEYSYIKYSLVTVFLFVSKSILSIAGTYFLTFDRLFGRLIGLCIPSCLVGLFLLAVTISKSEKTQITKYWKKALLFNLPLIPHYLASVVLNASDKIMIEKITGVTDAGFYTIAYQFSGLALIVFNALNTAYNPFSMKSIQKKSYKELAKTTEIIVIISIAFSMLLITFAPEGILILGGKKYLDSLAIVPTLIVGIFLSSFYLIYSNVEFVFEKTKLIFPITLTGALLNVVLNYFFVKKYGYGAAAYTTLICNSFILASHGLISRKIIGQDIFNTKKLLLYVLILLMYSIFVKRLYNIIPVIRYCLALILLIICIYFSLKYLKTKN